MRYNFAHNNFINNERRTIKFNETMKVLEKYANNNNYYNEIQHNNKTILNSITDAAIQDYIDVLYDTLHANLFNKNNSINNLEKDKELEFWGKL